MGQPFQRFGNPIGSLQSVVFVDAMAGFGRLPYTRRQIVIHCDHTSLCVSCVGAAVDLSNISTRSCKSSAMRYQCWTVFSRKK